MRTADMGADISQITENAQEFEGPAMTNENLKHFDEM